MPTPTGPDLRAVPASIAAAPPIIDRLVVLDGRLSFGRLLRALAAAGYTVINNQRGQLVITERPEDFKPAPRAEELSRGR